MSYSVSPDEFEREIREIRRELDKLAHDASSNVIPIQSGKLQKIDVLDARVSALVSLVSAQQALIERLTGIVEEALLMAEID